MSSAQAPRGVVRPEAAAESSGCGRDHSEVEPSASFESLTRAWNESVEGYRHGRHTRVALVHDWLTGMRGGEKCLEVALPPLARRAAATRCCTSRGSVSADDRDGCRSAPASCSSCPRVDRYYRYLLPLMPRGGRAGGCRDVRPGRQLQPLRRQGRRRRRRACRTSATASRRCATPGTCATPTSAGAAGSKAGCVDRAAGPAARLGPPHRRRRHALRRHQPDRAAAHPRVLRPRQRRHLPAGRYRLLHARPPCRARTIYLVVSAFAPYKRLDLAIEACKRLGRRLVVIGSGQDEATAADAGGADDRTFLGWQPDEVIRDHLRRCRALLFPGEEDFGIVPRRGAGVRHAGDRLRQGRRRPRPSSRSGERPRPDRRLVRRADRRLPGRRDRRASSAAGRVRPARPLRRTPCASEATLRVRVLRLRRRPPRTAPDRLGKRRNRGMVQSKNEFDFSHDETRIEHG